MMPPGAAGTDPMLTASVEAVEAPQEVLATTEIVPPVVPGVAEIELVIDVPVHPVGKVQVYEVAPPTGVMEYVCATPLHTVLSPAIAPGAGGAEPAVTARTLAVETWPQAFVAVTAMLPLPVAVVAVIEAVVDDPVQPVGSVQV